MASITLNGETVHLQPQPREDFIKLAQLVYANLNPDRGVDATIAQVLFDARLKDQGLDSRIVQTCLWALHDLGVRDLVIDMEGKKIEVREAVMTDMRRGDVRAFAAANIESGRAFIGAVQNVHVRHLKINGERIRAFPQPKEEVEKLIKQIQANRLVNEDFLFTAVRAVGAYLSQGKNIENAEFRAAVEIAAGMGVAEIAVDVPSSKLMLRGLNEHNAAAMVLLQGGDYDKVQLARERIRKLVEAIQKSVKDSQEAGKQEPVRVTIPPIVGSRHTKRRGA